MIFKRSLGWWTKDSRTRKFVPKNLRLCQGFDGRPPALESMDPLLDLGMTGNAKMAKKARKKQGWMCLKNGNAACTRKDFNRGNSSLILMVLYDSI